MRLVSDDVLGILTIWTEAQGEGFNGKVAVGEVIRRRTQRRYQSDGTIAGTVAKRYQFSALNDDKADNDLFIRSLKISWGDQGVPECERAWIWSATSNLVPDAVLYCNLDVAQPSWARPDKLVTKIDHHSFFKD